MGFLTHRLKVNVGDICSTWLVVGVKVKCSISEIEVKCSKHQSILGLNLRSETEIEGEY